MVTDKIEDFENIWTQIRTIRKAGKTSENYVLAPLEQISQNFQKLSTVLNFTKESDDILDLSEDSINAAARMFFYLNSIPQKNNQTNWNGFFNNIISSVNFVTEARPVAAPLLSILKILRNYKSEDDKIIADKLMKKLESLYDFKYYQPDSTSKNKQTNMFNVDGEYILHLHSTPVYLSDFLLAPTGA